MDQITIFYLLATDATRVSLFWYNDFSERVIPYLKGFIPCSSARSNKISFDVSSKRTNLHDFPRKLSQEKTFAREREN